MSILLYFISVIAFLSTCVDSKTFPPRNAGRLTRYQEDPPPFTIANMTCDFFLQPLNHFDLPRNQSGFYRQRFCYYNGFVNDNDVSKAPVFFYAGNESPLEEYINQTGLIWQSAPQFGAQVVFVEHRYEGKSLPNPEIPHCLAYAASYQALADYANFIDQYLFQAVATEGRGRRPVIVFGGSYGGMLAAWMRMIYPHLVAGAIAGSAPIGGFPNNRPRSIDAAYRVIRHGLAQSLPPSLPPSEKNNCPNNLLAAWPLITILAQEETGRKLLQESFRLCQVPSTNDAQTLISWAQSPWFDMAEGSFPYPSSYITFALTHKPVKLPAWPLQTACWNASALHRDWKVSFHGNVSDVLYNITYGDSGLSIAVDWDGATAIMPCHDNDKTCRDNVQGSDTVRGLLESVRNAVSVWFNVTQDIQCYNLTAAPNQHTTSRQSFVEDDKIRQQRNLRNNKDSPSEQCAKRMAQGSWPSLCCNEEMNLIITDASGLGYDSFWPPSHPRGTRSYSDIYRSWTEPYAECRDPDGIFGFPQSTVDPWATWMDIRYGGLHLSAHSNIIFSNGLLDPWSSAGVYAKGGDPAERPDDKHGNPPYWRPYNGVAGLYVQNITSDDSMIALIMDVGGHHTDLMYSHPADPESVHVAREVQRDYIHRWIRDFGGEEEITSIT